MFSLSTFIAPHHIVLTLNSQSEAGDGDGDDEAVSSQFSLFSHCVRGLTQINKFIPLLKLPFNQVSLLYGSMLKLVSELLCGRGGQKMRPSLCAQISGFHSSKPGLAPRSFFGVEDFVDDDNSRPYTYLKGKKSKNPNKHVSFKQRTVAYMEPFTLDVFISKRFVSASITHRVTCKQVAVAGTNSKDIKAVLKSRSDIPACLSVGQILANRAREADVYTASYTPRDRDKFEGKIRAVVQSLIDNGIDIKVYLD